MVENELIDNLKSAYQTFADYFDSLTQEQFEFHKYPKWSAGQEMDHIVKSTLPISKILGNKAFIKSRFGTIDRKPMSYQELIDVYQTGLKTGVKAMGQFIPDNIGWEQKNSLKNQLNKIIEKISDHLKEYTEQELNALVIPHPFLGKLTVKEMILFTTYHAGHHIENSKRNLRHSLS